MKKLSTLAGALFASVLAIASVVPGFAFAQLGTMGNPIYIQDVTIRDPFTSLDQRIQQQNLLNALNAQTQTIQNMSMQQTISSLQAQYGTSAYYACWGKYSACTGSNAANPNTRQSCLQYIQYCLARQSPSYQTYQSAPAQNVTPTSAQASDASCKSFYGQGARAYSTGCECSPGYQWAPDNKSCVTQSPQTSVPSTSNVPMAGYQEVACLLRKNVTWNKQSQTCDCLAEYTRTVTGGDCDIRVGVEQIQSPSSQVQSPQWNNDLRCQAARGEHGVWTGIIDESGNAVCACKNGYQYSGTICVSAPTKVPAEVKKVPQKQITSAESNMVIPEISTSAVIQVTKEIEETPKQKRGFWSWLLGIFGI